MVKTIKSKEEYLKQYGNLMESKLSYQDLVKLIIEARVARDKYRQEKNHYLTRFRELRNQVVKLKTSLRKNLRDIDTRTLKEKLDK